jgi:glycosidase
MDDIWSQEIQDALNKARTPAPVKVAVDGKPVTILKPFPSPADWRDQWIYFLMVDRFNNPKKPPAASPYDSPVGVYQGGSIEGVRQRLPYLKELGAGAIWMTPVFRNCPNQPGAYHGYGFQNILEAHPDFGSREELIALVDEAHARGLYVIFDIVINHAGDVFEYPGHGSKAPLSTDIYPILWRGADGKPNPLWSQAPKSCPAGAAVAPRQLRNNACFRRKGCADTPESDFESLKEINTSYFMFNPIHGDHYPVRDTLIRAYQYIIAEYDVDGFRIDTLKYVEPEFARTFGNAMREFACSIGKKNFFTFGEVWDGEEKIREFIGKSGTDADAVIGVDAALDFPLFGVLPNYVKGLKTDKDMHVTPVDVFTFFKKRKDFYKNHISSHGMASSYFVTFLDNHDQKNRFLYADPATPNKWDDQLFLAVATLFCLQGVPCLYYGTEQGFSGAGNIDWAVREALWGKPNAFDTSNPFFLQIKQIAQVRAARSSLRYGRQYFRPVNTGGGDYYLGSRPLDALAFSRILNDEETLVVCNPKDAAWSGAVLVDFSLNAYGAWRTLYSNKNRAPSFTTREIASGQATVEDKPISAPIRVVDMQLKPMEVLILGKG